MTDIKTAAQDAFFAKLNVAGVTNLAPVVQHVLEDTQPPLVVVGDVSTEPVGGKDGGLDMVTIDIITMIRSPQRASLFALQAAVRTQLDGQVVTGTGILLSDPVELSSEDDILEDGETYMGTQRYQTFVQPS
jgi:hypothetical protein